MSRRRRRTFVYEQDIQALEIWRGGQLLCCDNYPISYTIEDCIEHWCSLWYEELRKLTITSSSGPLTIGVFHSEQHGG